MKQFNEMDAVEKADVFTNADRDDLFAALESMEIVSDDNAVDVRKGRLDADDLRLWAVLMDAIGELRAYLADNGGPSFMNTLRQSRNPLSPETMEIVTETLVWDKQDDEDEDAVAGVGLVKPVTPQAWTD